MTINIVKPDLTSYQKDFLYNGSRFTFTEASTKVGKTFSHIWWIFERAHESWNQNGYNHWWVAPVYSQTKIAFKRLKSKLSGQNVYKINESNLTITCPNGAVIHFKSAEKPDNLYGEDVYSVVFDEAPRARVDAYYALRSTITATNGVIKLIGNFGGVSNWMHQIKEKALTDSNYSYFKITAWDAVNAGILKESEVLQAQKDLPPKIFKQLYLAEEQEDNDQLITFDAINDLFTNDHVKGGERFISADIALHGSDNFIICTWDGWRLIDFESIEKIEADEVEQKLKEKAQKYNVRRGNIVYDADGLGSFLRGYLAGAKPFNNGSSPIIGKNYKNLKTECGYEFAKKVNGGEVKIDCYIDRQALFKELECLKSYKLDTGGKIQLLPKKEIKQLIGHSPDILDALVMRTYFSLKPKIKTRVNVVR